MNTTKLSFVVDPLHSPPLSDYAPKERFGAFDHTDIQGSFVKMDDLERELNRRDPIGDIAAIVGKCTYGEIEQLASELVENQGLGDIDTFAVMKRLHEWQKNRKVTPRE